jgi:hypothetical protein
MLYHFAITPDAFEPSSIPANSREAVVLVELLRGIADNGLLANLHNGAWHKVATNSYDKKEVDAALRDKLAACFKLISDRNRLVRHPLSAQFTADSDFCWLHRAIERHLADPSYPFRGIVSTDDYIQLSEVSDAAMVPLHKALDHTCWQGRSISARFIKTEDQLRRYLKPILRYAQKVVLIDPYMSCHKDRFFNTVQHCADLLGKRDGSQQKGLIHIHAGDPQTDSDPMHQESPRDRLREWERQLRPVISQWGHKFEVFLWKNRPGGKTFHDRYLITDQCGVRAPGGLDFADNTARANISSWSLLEADEIRDIIHCEFHQAKSPYQQLGSRKIT